MDVEAFERVYEAFGDFHAFFALSFGRKQWREHSEHYLQALLVQSQERRNAENLAEMVPVSARALQRFLTEARWDDEAVIARLQEYLGCRLAHPLAVWVFDGSDFPKQGVKSVGVTRSVGPWGRWLIARLGCFWPTWGRAGGLWWTSACICRRAGPRILPAVRRRACQRPSGGTGRRPTWPWRCCAKPGHGGTSAPVGPRGTTRSGCPLGSETV